MNVPYSQLISFKHSIFFFNKSKIKKLVHTNLFYLTIFVTWIVELNYFKQLVKTF